MDEEKLILTFAQQTLSLVSNFFQNVLKMHLPIRSLLIILIVSTSSPLFGAERIPDIPDITGIWTSDDSMIFPNASAKVEGHTRLEITHQEGALFTGIKEWQRHVKKADLHNEVVDGKYVVGKEPVAGVIGYDGQIYIVEQGDNGTLQGSLVGHNKMQCIFVEPITGLAARQEFVRKKK